ncbi:hypothetical protein PsW64_03140 [Pseudovibrio sp. W64]|uniref:hypothetical protein n=1 Tax=Pseudovibrio sp. W64 TaxID=1735583 RepID=UPI0007AEE48E|nr:hypothetical protein [Pseudovibrio sp. W64]KZK79510.1 hypothetical protein PsW64_03140 [Pseudovibrio sp. W64]
MRFDFSLKFGWGELLALLAIIVSIVTAWLNRPGPEFLFSSRAMSISAKLEKSECKIRFVLPIHINNSGQKSGIFLRYSPSGTANESIQLFTSNGPEYVKVHNFKRAISSNNQQGIVQRLMSGDYEGFKMFDFQSQSYLYSEVVVPSMSSHMEYIYGELLLPNSTDLLNSGLAWSIAAEFSNGQRLEAANVYELKNYIKKCSAKNLDILGS